MIICHPLQIIFVKTLKVGGTSFEIALSKHCSESCVITSIDEDDEAIRKQRGYRTAQNYDFTHDNMSENSSSKNFGFKGEFWNHMPSIRIKEKIPSRIWNTYQKVAIHRNPFDVIISDYYWSQRLRKLEHRRPFDGWFFKEPEMATRNMRIAPIHGVAAVDRIIRYECFEEDIKSMGIKDLWETFDGIRTKAYTRPQLGAHILEFYKNKETVINKIVELCRDEIAFFKYEVPSP